MEKIGQPETNSSLPSGKNLVKIENKTQNALSYVLVEAREKIKSIPGILRGWMPTDYWNNEASDKEKKNFTTDYSNPRRN